MLCDGVSVAVVGWPSHFPLAAVSECRTQIGLAPYAEPPCQVVTEAGPGNMVLSSEVTESRCSYGVTLSWSTYIPNKIDNKVPKD